MGVEQLKSYINKYGEIVRGGILFLFIYLFFCLYIDLRLVYHVFGASGKMAALVCLIMDPTTLPIQAARLSMTEMSMLSG